MTTKMVTLKKAKAMMVQHKIMEMKNRRRMKMKKKLSLCMIGPCTTQMDLMKTKMSTLTTMIE